MSVAAQSNTCTGELEDSCCGVCGCRKMVAVTAAIHRNVQDFLSDPERLFSIVDCFGSPLNVIFPDRVLENWLAFKQVLLDHRLKGNVLFTTKPNRSNALLDLLANHAASVDVSSLGALNAALSAGIPGKRIQATGPKTVQYILNALRHECSVSVDSLEELDAIASILNHTPNISAPSILVRLSGFRSTRMHLARSKGIFGISVDKVSEVFQRLIELRSKIILKGFAHHLHTPTEDERVVAIEDTLDAFVEAKRLGLNPTTINIGGGFRVSYAACNKEWQRFQTYLKASLLGDVKPITWNASGLGYRISDNGIVGAPSFIEHFATISGALELRKLLERRLPSYSNATAGSVLSDTLIELEVEPGRAILDQAGITLARVTFCKESSQNEMLIGLEMNHSNLFSNEQKLLTQPLFFPQKERQSDQRGMFLVGNLCIPNDIIQYQKVYPGFRPGIGDIVVFINTGAYLMDFVEAPMLNQPVARKIAATHNANGWKIVLDEEYTSIRKEMYGSL